jgi:hypothetical protein
VHEAKSIGASSGGGSMDGLTGVSGVLRVGSAFPDPPFEFVRDGRPARWRLVDEAPWRRAYVELEPS